LGDCVAGITLACLLIPQGLSYATALCKLDAIHGLYGIAFPAISYAFFGMSRSVMAQGVNLGRNIRGRNL
jgi:MFS superfamily sulfate permease-like transporter